MEQSHVTFETVLSGISDIFSKINKSALLVKEKNDERLQLLQTDAKALQNLSESLSEPDDQNIFSELQRVEDELSALGSTYQQLTCTGAGLRQEVDRAKHTVQVLGEQRNQQSLAAHPKARYSVNVFRDMSKINWHEEHEPHQLKGFVRSKGGLRTFCFDRKKQSTFFIANSLWDMGEDDSGEENASKGHSQGASY
ncbi:kinetochore protein Spc24-like [Elysia marginata]|uniref:Kinetochore protein Spc24 n=1 Tax=Elysia marginata TaxID=1093978 RepID=A0AAV4EIC6_9GAST|nr:kinetochore protein Spc24-like [Elysia marginata]